MKSSEECQRPIHTHTNLRIVFSITLVAIMGVDTITPAFPKMMQELGISQQEVVLLISVFTLPMVITTLFFGVLGDRWGRRKILFPSLVLFGIAGGACTFVRDFNLLLILRFFQGIGASSCMPLGNTIIGDIYSGKERTAAMGYNSSFVSIAHASFPFIGGAIAMIGWYYPFLLFFMAIPVALIVLFLLKNPEPKCDQNLREYLSSAWQSMKNRTAVGLFVAHIFTFIIFYGSYLAFFPILVGSFGASPFIIGLILSSLSITAAIVSSQIGKLAKMYSEINLLKAAFVLYTLALIITPLVPNIWLLLIPTIIFGIGHGINIPTTLTLLAGLAPTKYRAAFMSVDEMVVRLGQTLGPIFMGLIFAVWGIGAIFYAGAGFAIAMLILVIIILK